jgi:flagellar hook-associated protein 2
MGTISTGIGLISGLDTATLIDQLMAIEARPKQLVEERIAVLTSQKTAFLDVNARLVTLDLSATDFLDANSFGRKKATSSNPSVLTATPSADAPVGTYQFTVDRLVSTHQMITKGFADADTSTFGTATTLRFESSAGRLDRET